MTAKPEMTTNPSARKIPVENLMPQNFCNSMPTMSVLVTDAYETFGEGFKQFPEKNEIQAE